MKSMYLSLTALIVAGLALINSVCELQDTTLVISFLGVLVTLLVGWNIVQYMYAKDEVHRISKEESDKAAGEAAQTVVSDLSKIFKGQTLMKQSTEPGPLGDELQRIDFIFQALELYKSCENPLIVSPPLDDALHVLKAQFEAMKSTHQLYVLEGKKLSYGSCLKDVQSPYIEACSALLSEAEEISQEEYNRKFPPDPLGLRIG